MSDMDPSKTVVNSSRPSKSMPEGVEFTISVTKSLEVIAIGCTSYFTKIAEIVAMDGCINGKRVADRSLLDGHYICKIPDVVRTFTRIVQSNLHLGSGEIADDTTTNNVESSSSPPLLLVAEYGEGRITRLEDNGAHTPLVIQMAASSNTDNDGDSKRRRRLCEPFQLLVTPYKDFMILERTTLCHTSQQQQQQQKWLQQWLQQQQLRDRK
ncbi:hypothetical protein IV203_000054 [Nitzschia inconspicua]|uniref:Uncharacterized protein n=1 Tax=Nitzschia inconspicua TaxID=303405 RepID=A0A9K3L643_9STRA|nr:hypothetical protein IV203_000054 [Nitzschia inconspicua]